MYFSVVVAVILDIVFYNTSMGYLEICGILMICISSILLVIENLNWGNEMENTFVIVARFYK